MKFLFLIALSLSTVPSFAASLCTITLMRNTANGSVQVGEMKKNVQTHESGNFGNIFREGEDQFIEVSGIINDKSDAEISLYRFNKLSISLKFLGKLKISGADQSVTQEIDRGRYTVNFSCASVK